MISKNDIKRIAYCMDEMLREDDINYLENIRIEEAKIRMVECCDCGILVPCLTEQTKRCRPCAKKRSKTLSKAKEKERNVCGEYE